MLPKTDHAIRIFTAILLIITSPISLPALMAQEEWAATENGEGAFIDPAAEDAATDTASGIPENEDPDAVLFAPAADDDESAVDEIITDNGGNEAVAEESINVDDDGSGAAEATAEELPFPEADIGSDALKAEFDTWFASLWPEDADDSQSASSEVLLEEESPEDAFALATATRTELEAERSRLQLRLNGQPGGRLRGGVKVEIERLERGLEAMGMRLQELESQRAMAYEDRPRDSKGKVLSNRELDGMINKLRTTITTKQADLATKQAERSRIEARIQEIDQLLMDMAAAETSTEEFDNPAEEVAATSTSADEEIAPDETSAV